MSGEFYRSFEDHHRGSRELIQSRQEVYLDFILPVCAMNPGAPVTDLGCGRGEWLELLGNHGVKAQGVDLDEGMLAACFERGLDVRKGDAIAFLAALPASSQAAVTAFHVVEHLPFETLHALAIECMRVLRPGGLLVLETPNPENLAVGTAGFYMDPTHERPLPSPLLEFLAKYHGFDRVKVLRLHELLDWKGGAPVTLVDVLAGSSPDYAIVAVKPGPSASHPEEASKLDAALSRDYGVSMTDLALRHERQSQEARVRVQFTADTARNVAAASQGGVRRLEARVVSVEHQQRAFEQQVAGRIASLHVDLARSQAELVGVYHSRSWRVTYPLRWLSAQRQALAQQGVRERARRLAAKLLALGRRAARRSPPDTPNGAAAEPAPHPMTAEALRVRDEIVRAIRTRVEDKGNN